MDGPPAGASVGVCSQFGVLVRLPLQPRQCGHVGGGIGGTVGEDGAIGHFEGGEGAEAYNRPGMLAGRLSTAPRQ